MPILVALLGLLLSWPATAGDSILTVSPGLDGGPPRPADPLLRTVDLADGSTLGSVAITLAGEDVNGGKGLARHPQTGVLYALLRIQGKRRPDLVTLDEQTGVAVLIGNTTEKFAAIAFTSDGTLYGVTGFDSSMPFVPGALYWIDVATAASMFEAQLTVAEGQALAFSPDDGLLYHAYGIGVRNQIGGEQFETIDTDTLVTTLVPLSRHQRRDARLGQCERAIAIDADQSRQQRHCKERRGPADALGDESPS